jgi:hypothetical protein
MGLEDKRTAYSLLSKYDKQAFWIKHINNYKINKTLTTKQKELIDLLLSKLDPDMFEDRVELNSFIKNHFLSVAQHHFSKHELRKIGYPNDRVISVGLTRIEKVEASCNCATSSLMIDDCESGQSCYPVTCTGGANNCGFIWIDDCDMGCR